MVARSAPGIRRRGARRSSGSQGGRTRTRRPAWARRPRGGGCRGRLGPGHRARRRRPLVGGDDGLEGLPLHRGDTRTRLRLNRCGVSSVAVQPGAEVELDGLVELARVEERVFLLVEGVELGRALIAGQRCGDEDERVGSLGMGKGEVERDPAAERVPDDGRPLDPEVVEEGADVLDVRKGPAGERRLSEAAQVWPYDLIPPDERFHLAVPEPPVADSRVEEDDRGSASAESKAISAP